MTMVQDLNMKLYNIEILQRKMMERITALESCCDDKSEPESLPIGHGLSKEQIADKLLFDKQREIEDLKRTVNQQAASMHNLYTKNQELEKDVEYWKKLVDVTEENRQKSVNRIDVYQCGLEKKIEELQYKIEGDEESYRIQERLLSDCEDRFRKLRDENQKLLLENSWLLKRAAEECK